MSIITDGGIKATKKARWATLLNCSNFLLQKLHSYGEALNLEGHGPLTLLFLPPMLIISHVQYITEYYHILQNSVIWFWKTFHLHTSEIIRIFDIVATFIALSHSPPDLFLQRLKSGYSVIYLIFKSNWISYVLMVANPVSFTLRINATCSYVTHNNTYLENL